MSVLAHLFPSMGHSEPAATRVLAYPLNKQPALAKALVGLLREVVDEFQPHVTCERGSRNQGRPDLTLQDAAGNDMIVIENKFWAGLTDAQPVLYLRKLIEGGMKSVLLFIVPTKRLNTVWKQLKRRCCDAGLPVNKDQERDWGIWVQIEGSNSAMLVTNWDHILNTLDWATSDHEIKNDIFQLRGLVAQQDSEAFLPLRSDEVTNVDMAKRMINYTELVDPIIGKLEGIVSNIDPITGGTLRTSHGWRRAGRYLCLHERFGAWLGISLRAWYKSGGITPLWLCFYQHRFSGLGEHWGSLERLFEDVVPYSNDKYIPITLTLGAEQREVIDDAANQIRHVAEVLSREIENPENQEEGT